MHVNKEKLHAIRQYRVRTDPVLIYKPDGKMGFQTDIPDFVLNARKKNIDTLNNKTPLRKVAEEELLEHLSQTSLRNSIVVQNPILFGVTMYAFDKFSSNMNMEVPNGLLLSWDTISNASDCEINPLLQKSEYTSEDLRPEKIEQKAEEIRRVLATLRNRIFVEEVYPTLPNKMTTGVPRAFWKRPDPALDISFKDIEQDDKEETTTQTQTASSQLALGDY